MLASLSNEQMSRYADLYGPLADSETRDFPFDPVALRWLLDEPRAYVPESYEEEC